MQRSVTAVGFEVLARRVWALHPAMTAYEAAYVGSHCSPSALRTSPPAAVVREGTGHGSVTAAHSP